MAAAARVRSSRSAMSARADSAAAAEGRVRHGEPQPGPGRLLDDLAAGRGQARLRPPGSLWPGQQPGAGAIRGVDLDAHALRRCGDCFPGPAAGLAGDRSPECGATRRIAGFIGWPSMTASKSVNTSKGSLPRPRQMSSSVSGWPGSGGVLAAGAGGWCRSMPAAETSTGRLRRAGCRRCSWR